MIKHGTTYSSIRPQGIEINESKVFVATNIVETTGENDHGDFLTYYSYDLDEYDKNEYMGMLAEKNIQLEQELLNTQMALCDLYEAMEKGGSL